LANDPFAPTAVIQRIGSRQGKTGSGTYLINDEHLSKHQTVYADGRSIVGTERELKPTLGTVRMA